MRDRAEKKNRRINLGKKARRLFASLDRERKVDLLRDPEDLRFQRAGSMVKRIFIFGK